MPKKDAAINIALATKSPIVTPYLISHFPHLIVVDGVLVSVIDHYAFLIVPPFKSGPTDPP